MGSQSSNWQSLVTKRPVSSTEIEFQLTELLAKGSHRNPQ